ncbi:MAG: hypothetical protein AVDCRST_MAG57-2047, partial [uncultured Blastococcus sp.]
CGVLRPVRRCRNRAPAAWSAPPRRTPWRVVRVGSRPSRSPSATPTNRTTSSSGTSLRPGP